MYSPRRSNPPPAARSTSKGRRQLIDSRDLSGPRRRQGASTWCKCDASRTQNAKEVLMLLTIAVILGIMWMMGMATSYTMGGLLHILLILAIIVVLFRIIQGRRVLS